MANYYATTYTTTSSTASINPDMFYKQDFFPEESVPKLKKEPAPMVIDNEAVEKLLGDREAIDILKGESVLLLYGTEQEKFMQNSRNRILSNYGINSGGMRYSDLFSIHAAPENIGWWINFMLFSSEDRKFGANLFRYMFYVSYYRKGATSRSGAMILLEINDEEFQKLKEFAPNTGLSIDSISEISKLSNDKMLIKILGKWNLKKR